jgi:transcriptional regulator with XRE-family HTH domain/cyclopropane fatty-acyl-phospholipid synthase-like methyltransferase
VISLGEQYLQGSFVKEGAKMPPMRKIPLSLFRCDPTADEKACGLLQMSHTTPPEVLYSTYWYRSGTNQTMRDHLKGIADTASALVGKKDAHVLDIGCNDGTLLGYYPASFKRFGVDPSDAVEKIPAGITVVQDLFPSKRLDKEAGGQKFDVITSIAMFYDLEDPILFVKNIKNDLAADGLWIFEMSYMPAMLKLNSYDTICHEHLEYYSLAVVEYILRKAEMKLVKVALNDINGGSICCYATHADNFKFNDAKAMEEIRELRRERGLTQEELGARANVSAIHVSNIERGEIDAGLDVIERIATALDVPLGALVGQLVSLSEEAIVFGKAFDQASPELRVAILNFLAGLYKPKGQG